MVKNILVTGGCGFIGSHFVEHIHRKTDWNIYIIDKLSYASNGLNRLRDSGMLDSHRVKVLTWDLSLKITPGLERELGDINILVHMCAQSDVDISIEEPVDTIENNVMSTVYILEYARNLKNLELFFYMGTDEVYGPDVNKENDRHNPTNPYSCSKSAAQMICLGYKNTYQIPLIIVNCMNIYGQRQHVNKFVPKCIKRILNGEKICIHADKTCTRAGSRFYLHARNVSDAILFLIFNGKTGENYNIVGEKELDNLSMAKLISEEIGKELDYELVDYHSTRPYHDFSYRLDGDKLAQLGWEPPVNIEQSLRETIRWTLDHPTWLEE